MTYTRDDIVAEARRWLGTPYHHQASVRGLGADCLGLVRGVWRALHGAEAEAVPAYSRDWAEATGEETMLAAARRHLHEIDRASAQRGDVLVFRFRAYAVAKHVGILTGASHMVHAVEGLAVAEVALVPWWRRHTAAAFSFPRIMS
jgi:NlpC/P60 family putative phage cell wall peptidase